MKVSKVFAASAGATLLTLWACGQGGESRKPIMGDPVPALREDGSGELLKSQGALKIAPAASAIGLHINAFMNTVSRAARIRHDFVFTHSSAKPIFVHEFVSNYECEGFLLSSLQLIAFEEANETVIEHDIRPFKAEGTTRVLRLDLGPGSYAFRFLLDTDAACQKAGMSLRVALTADT